MKTILSYKLKSPRKEYGLTQEDLALKCGGYELVPIKKKEEKEKS